MNRRNFYWNSIAGIINAAEAVVMSMVVTRVTNLGDAGILTIAFAVGNLFLNIGKFGVRNYHVTDVKRQYKNSSYLLSRIISILLMFITTVGYVVLKINIFNESLAKESVIVAICCIYMVEAVEDLFWGEYQRDGRLDLGAKIFICRWCSILIAFTIAIVFFHSLVYAIWIGLMVSIIVFIFAIFVAERKHKQSQGDLSFLSSQNNLKGLFDFANTKCLFKEVVPLFVVSFLTFYINNSPKYALDGNVADEIQACYGFVAMPVFVIGLLNSMIYQPSVVWLSERWEAGETKAFRAKIRKQCIVIILISITCVIGVALIGIPVLSGIYNTNLLKYKDELLILQFAGMFLAIDGYFAMILTLMRHQKELMYGYVFVSILALLFMRICAKAYNTSGVALMYLVCVFVLCIIFIYLYEKYIKVCKKGNYQ